MAVWRAAGEARILPIDLCGITDSSLSLSFSLALWAYSNARFGGLCRGLRWRERGFWSESGFVV